MSAVIFRSGYLPASGSALRARKTQRLSGKKRKPAWNKAKIMNHRNNTQTSAMMVGTEQKFDQLPCLSPTAAKLPAVSWRTRQEEDGHYHCRPYTVTVDRSRRSMPLQADIAIGLGGAKPAEKLSAGHKILACRPRQTAPRRFHPGYGFSIRELRLSPVLPKKQGP